MVTKRIAIEWNRRAVRQLIDLPAKIGVNLHDKVGELEESYDGDNDKNPLNLTNDQRLEASRHRVLFSVSDRITIIRIDEVTRRDHNTN
jgi:mRNA-degrading endonuclease RelE of RelBE toxin-antitoxin system